MRARSGFASDRGSARRRPAAAEASPPAAAPPGGRSAAQHAAAAAPLPQRQPHRRPTPNKGDVAWMLVSTALVLMMSVPALALFYGGMVRSKNMLSVLMQVFVVFSLITVLWCVYGYSLAFTEGNAFFGGFDRLFLKGTFDPPRASSRWRRRSARATSLPELVYVAFQATFAAITCCLILGAFAERIKFSAVLLFMVIWFTFSYLPIAHMVWFWAGPDAYTDARSVVDATNAKAGYIWQMGALDFAGGTVVHINAGVAGLVGAYLVGKRIGYGQEAMPPHNLTMTMIGASLLWVGWFGFNAGSALEANGSAALAFINTYLATACAVLSWTFAEWMFKGKPSMLGAASGAVAGLVAITPAAGNVGIPGAFVIGFCRRRRLPVGRERAEKHAGRRRLARRVRRACGRRDPRRAADGRVRIARARRAGLRHRLGHGQDDRLRNIDRCAAPDPGQGGRRNDRLVGRRGVHLRTRSSTDDRPARDRRRGARRPRHQLARRDCLPQLISTPPEAVGTSGRFGRPFFWQMQGRLPT